MSILFYRIFKTYANPSVLAAVPTNAKNPRSFLPKDWRFYRRFFLLFSYLFSWAKMLGIWDFWGNVAVFGCFTCRFSHPIFLAVSFLVGIFAHIFEERDRGAHLGELLLGLFFAQPSSSGRHSYREKPRNSLSLLAFPRPFSRAHNPEVMRFKSHPRNQSKILG